MMKEYKFESELQGIDYFLNTEHQAFFFEILDLVTMLWGFFKNVFYM